VGDGIAETTRGSVRRTARNTSASGDLRQGAEAGARGEGGDWCGGWVDLEEREGESGRPWSEWEAEDKKRRQKNRKTAAAIDARNAQDKRRTQSVLTRIFHKRTGGDGVT
jgi:hypothetical protein